MECMKLLYQSNIMECNYIYNILDNYMKYCTRVSLISLECADVITGVAAQPGCSNLAPSSQESTKASPWTSHILCRIQHAVTTRGTCAISMSFCLSSLLHLAFNQPKAFSTTIRALER